MSAHSRARSPHGGARSPIPIVTAGIVSVVAFLLLQFLSPEKPLTYSEEMIEAAMLMERATTAARDFCDSTGIQIDETIDPNRTCLIGPELTPLMTTLGHLDAKRTTTDPALASLIVHLLDQAGVSSGDTIAVGSSGSFPALLVAAVAAAEAMDVHPIVIISLGASTYGATDPEFNLLDMYALLLSENVLTTPPAAVSLGGGEDVGNGFDAGLKADLLLQIAASGVLLISEADLRANVAARMAIYEGAGRTRRISAFVNAGGSHANLGTSALALHLRPGLNTAMSIPPPEQRGVLFEMAARDLPIIHLLFIRGLATLYGLTWDPIPLSEPGQMALHVYRPGTSRALWLIGLPYLVATILLVAVHTRTATQRAQAASDSTI